MHGISTKYVRHLCADRAKAILGVGGTANATIPAKAPQPTQRPNKHQTNKDDAALFARINKSSCDTNKAASSMDALLRTGLTPTIEVATVEAIHSVAQAQRLAQRQAQAVRVLSDATQPNEEVKDQIRRQGKVKLSKVPHRQIVAMARGPAIRGWRASSEANRRRKADRGAVAVGSTRWAAHNLGNKNERSGKRCSAATSAALNSRT